MAINLGDINFGLGPDTTRLEKARSQILAFGQAVNKAARDQSDGARAAEAAMRRQEAALVRVLNQTLKMNDAIRQSGANPTYFNSTTTAINRLVKEIGTGQASALQFQRGMEDVTTTLSRTQRALNAHMVAQQDLAREEKIADDALAQQEQWSIRVSKAMFAATQQVENYNAQVARTRAPSTLSNSANAALTGLQGNLNGPQTNMSFLGAQQQFKAAMTANSNALRDFNRLGQDSKVADALARISNVALLLNGPLGGIAARFNLLSTLSDKVSLSTAAMVLGVAGGIFAFEKLGAAAVSAAKEFQTVQLGLNAVNDNMKTTTLEMSYLMDVSNRSGQAFSSIAHEFLTLKAASEGTNLAGEKTREIFEEITFSAAKLGLGSEATGRALYAIQQIMSKGRVEAQELRQQLGNDLPGAAAVMARALGVTTSELAKMMKQGKVTSDALIPFAKEYARTLNVDVKGSIDTINTAEGRLNNAFLNFNRAVDTSIGFSKAYTASINILIGALTFLTDHISTIIKVAGTAAISIGFMFAPQIIGGFVVLINMIKAATVAMVSFNIAVDANPFGKLLTIIVRLALAVAGAVIGFKVMDSLVGGQAVSSSDSLTASINENAKALIGVANKSKDFQAQLRTQIELEITAAEAALNLAGAEYQAAQAASKTNTLGSGFEKVMGFAAVLTGMGSADEVIKRIDAASSQPVDDALAKINEARNQLQALSKQYVQLGTLGTNPSNGDDGTALTSGMTKGMREASEAIADTKAQYDRLLATPAQQQFLTAQDSLNKSIREFHDKLVDAKVPAAAVATLTGEFADNATRLANLKLQLAEFPNIFTKLGETLGTAMDSGMGQFIDDVASGADALTSLASIGRSVALDLIKTFAQLAVINPLKNLLGIDAGGGTSFPSFNLFGAIGSLLTGGGSSGGLTPATYDSALPTFAGGGSFTVGGSNGGVDKQLVKFYATRGENVTVANSNSGSANDNSIRAIDLHVHLQGANGDAAIEAAVDRGIASAVEHLNNTNTQRTQQALINGRLTRVPGFRSSK